MANVKIGRIALHVPHMTPQAARELADGVARGVAASAGEATTDAPRLRVDLAGIAGESTRALEARIAREVARALRRR